ncbi:MAG: DUF899 family protein [Betaproteobacteria bacterium]|nr:DUF899 family protein [Betaproteobacteria bacterium]
MKFPNETKPYRSARNRLLRAETALRRQVEKVAALRRKLPAGGKVPQDYVFEEGDPPRAVKLSELFGERNTVVAYSFMYGPKMEKACPMCTSMLDGLNGSAQHIAQCANLVVIAKSPIARVLEYARSRGWSNLRLLSSAGNRYNADYFGESAAGAQLPMLNVFVRRKGAIRHFYGTELLFAKTDPGQNNRHVDALWPLWNLLDFTPEGRGKDWYPKLQY